MSQQIAVSVVISTRNRAQYLPDVLTSLAAQQCDATFEAVLVDNGSTDNTSHLIAAWCDKDPRFRPGFEPRLGLSYGKNAGIRLARAPLLLFTDDDVLPAAHWIQSYLELFSRRHGEMMLAGGPQIPIPHDLGPWPGWFDEPALADIALLHYGEERPLHAHEYVWGANMAVPARLFDRLGLWNEAVGRRGEERGTFEDTEFQDRLRSAGGTVFFCPPAIIHHRIPREHITPRQISSTAFARGRNDVWIKNIPIWREVELIPRRNLAAGLLLLAAAMFRWTFWAAAFRLFHKRGIFERARRAAFAAGHSLDSLRAGRASVHLYLAVSRLTFGIRALLLRLSPDTA